MLKYNTSFSLKKRESLKYKGATLYCNLFFFLIGHTAWFWNLSSLTRNQTQSLVSDNV